MNYVELMIGQQEYEERVRWLRRLYGSSSPNDQPSRVQRLASRLLFVLSRTLIWLGERMQQPAQNMPAAAPSSR